MVRLVAELDDTLPALAEVFREHGYGATSPSLITAATGLGKGSLYHFFPGGKQEMASAVLADIEQWFTTTSSHRSRTQSSRRKRSRPCLTRSDSTSARDDASASLAPSRSATVATYSRPKCGPTSRAGSLSSLAH